MAGSSTARRHPELAAQRPASAKRLGHGRAVPELALAQRGPVRRGAAATSPDRRRLRADRRSQLAGSRSGRAPAPREAARTSAAASGPPGRRAPARRPAAARHRVPGRAAERRPCQPRGCEAPEQRVRHREPGSARRSSGSPAVRWRDPSRGTRCATSKPGGAGSDEREPRRAAARVLDVDLHAVGLDRDAQVERRVADAQAPIAARALAPVDEPGRARATPRRRRGRSTTPSGSAPGGRRCRAARRAPGATGTSRASIARVGDRREVPPGVVEAPLRAARGSRAPRAAAGRPARSLRPRAARRARARRSSRVHGRRRDHASGRGASEPPSAGSNVARGCGPAVDARPRSAHGPAASSTCGGVAARPARRRRARARGAGPAAGRAGAAGRHDQQQREPSERGNGGRGASPPLSPCRAPRYAARPAPAGGPDSGSPASEPAVIDKDLLEILACPETHQPLAEADAGRPRARQRAHRGRRPDRTSAARPSPSRLAAALVREDGKVALPDPRRHPGAARRRGHRPGGREVERTALRRASRHP